MFQIIDFFAAIFLTSLIIEGKEKKIRSLHISTQRMYKYLKTLLSLHPPIVIHIKNGNKTYYALTDAGFEIWTRFRDIVTKYPKIAKYLIDLRSGLRSKLYTALANISVYTVFSRIDERKVLTITQKSIDDMFKKYHITIRSSDWILDMIECDIFDCMNGHYLVNEILTQFIDEIKAVDRYIYSQFEKHITKEEDDLLIQLELQTTKDVLSKWNCDTIAVCTYQGLIKASISNGVSDMYIAASTGILISTLIKVLQYMHFPSIDNAHIYLIGKIYTVYVRCIDNDNIAIIACKNAVIADVLRYGFNDTENTKYYRSMIGDGAQYQDPVWSLINISASIPNALVTILSETCKSFCKHFNDEWKYSVLYIDQSAIGFTQDDGKNEMVVTDNYTLPQNLQPNWEHITYKNNPDRCGYTINYNVYDDLNTQIRVQKDLFLPFSHVLEQHIQHLIDFFKKI